MPRWHVLGLVLIGLAPDPLALAGDEAVADTGDTAAVVPDEHDAIWAWLDRLDGEVPDDATLRAAEEIADMDLEELAFLQKIHGLDIPDDYYRDPRRVLMGDPYLLARVDPREFDIPVVVNEHVEQWVRYFTGPGRKYFHRWLERRSKYEPMIRRELEAAGLPRDVLYLSMIESGFNAHAYSHAAAAGLWQFIPGTARMYDLDIDYWLDERRDPELATKAAMKMLGELHAMFGDWPLAFAAYNTGPGRVKRALDRAGEGADYWTLLEKDLLHPETQGYVPKIIAAAIIGHHPDRYGFTDVVKEPPLVYDTVPVDDVFDLDVLAECAGIDGEAFRELNPALRRYTLPEGGADVRVPKGTGEPFRAAVAAVPPEKRVRLVLHEVARGETLSIVAAKYHVSTSDLMAANHLSNANKLYVGQKLVVPLGQGAVEALAAREAPKPAPPPAAKEEPKPQPKPEPPPAVVTRYTVRSGDTLSTIADKLGVATRDLQLWNGIVDPRDLKAGQVLTVKGGHADPSASSSSVTVKATTYTVRSGDTLSAIADRYDMKVADLMAYNGIRDASSLKAGQTLKLTGTVASSSGSSAGSYSTHTVRSGESLGIIAEKYHVSVSDLKAWNGLKSSTIYPGDKLKIRAR
jgi:membrane-bound lytic murein transglycosylase D